NLWNSLGYWNLVQRLLDSRSQADRPGFVDYDEGWRLFFKLYEILKPEFCLVLGKASFNALGNYLHNHQTEWEKEPITVNPDEKIFKLNNGTKKMTLLFINHPSGSRRFDYQKWADIFKTEFNI